MPIYFYSSNTQKCFCRIQVITSDTTSPVISSINNPSPVILGDTPSDYTFSFTATDEDSNIDYMDLFMPTGSSATCRCTQSTSSCRDEDPCTIYCGTTPNSCELTWKGKFYFTTDSMSVSMFAIDTASSPNPTNPMLTSTITVNPTYCDDDEDGYYSITSGICAIDLVSTSPGDDCDDTDDTIYLGATEICGNDIDENCDGTADDGCDDPYDCDLDLDGSHKQYSKAYLLNDLSIKLWGYNKDARCMSGEVTGVQDCSDNPETDSAAIYRKPGCSEDLGTCNNYKILGDVCDGIDNDCDGNTDNIKDTINPLTSPLDCENRGACSNSYKECNFGSWSSCIFSSDDFTQLDLTTSTTEAICDGIDNDCDGKTDEGCDSDGDGYVEDGLECHSGFKCTNDDGASLFSCKGDCSEKDCDDTEYDINFDTLWVLDNDKDRYYTNSKIQCKKPEGIGWHSSDEYGGEQLISGDCNDDDDDGNAGQHWFYDEDGDGFYDTTNSDKYNVNCRDLFMYPNSKKWVEDVSVTDAQSDCDDYVADDTSLLLDGVSFSCPTKPSDCKEINAFCSICIHPGAEDFCDRKLGSINDDVDSNCIDDDADRCSALKDDEFDKDGDEYCDISKQSAIIEEPGLINLYCPFTDISKSTFDCKDDEGYDSIHPGAIEICDGFDNDCDGMTDEGCDKDGDGVFCK